MRLCRHLPVFFFFFNDTATTEIYTLSLHDALPILTWVFDGINLIVPDTVPSKMVALTSADAGRTWSQPVTVRSEEHTSELQSRQYLVCRLLLEKKKQTKPYSISVHHNKISTSSQQT